MIGSEAGSVFILESAVGTGDSRGYREDFYNLCRGRDKDCKCGFFWGIGKCMENIDVLGQTGF